MRGMRGERADIQRGLLVEGEEITNFQSRC